MQCFIKVFELCYKACVVCDILKCWMEILRSFTSNPRSINFFLNVANFSFQIHPHVNCVNSFQNSGNFENYDLKFNSQFCVQFAHTIFDFFDIKSCEK